MGLFSFYIGLECLEGLLLKELGMRGHLTKVPVAWVNVSVLNLVQIVKCLIRNLQLRANVSTWLLVQLGNVDVHDIGIVELPSQCDEVFTSR